MPDTHTADLLKQRDLMRTNLVCQQLFLLEYRRHVHDVENLGGPLWLRCRRVHRVDQMLAHLEHVLRLSERVAAEIECALAVRGEQP